MRGATGFGLGVASSALLLGLAYALGMIDARPHGDVEGLPVRGARPEPDVRAPALAEAADASHARRLEEELRQGVTREAELRVLLVQARASAAPAGPAATPAAEGEVPAAAREAARDLGVPDAALQAAFAAHEGLRKEPHAAHERLIADLSAKGPDGFRALVALLRGGLSGVWYERLVAATWTPGLEDLLIDTAEDPRVAPFSRWSAFASMGRADARRVREYLADRISREEDPGLYFSAATALGRLHETSWVRSFDPERILRPGWSGVRGHVLTSLGETGGAEAARALVGYLRHPRADHLDWALRALFRVDRAAARTEARSLLDGARGEALAPEAREAIEAVLRE